MKESEVFIEEVLKKKYLKDGEKSWEDVAKRVSKVFPEIEPFIVGKKFLPAGSILSGGKSKSNCYFIPIKEDSIEGIADFRKEMMRTFSWRGGVGTTLEVLRPKGEKVHNAAETSTGSVSFMPSISLDTQTIAQNGRRGASIITHHILHPDAEDFINSKGNPEKVFPKDPLRPNYVPDISGANISIKLTDDFMRKVNNDEEWEFKFPEIDEYRNEERKWNGDFEEWSGKWKSYGKKPAKEIFREIAENSWKFAEPGILFWDNVLKGTPWAVFKDVKPKGVNPCFVGDTLIAVADGRNVMSIKDLAEENKPFKIYSARFIAGEWRNNIGTGKAFYTGKKKVITLSLENGDKITLTPDHKVALKDGSYIEAINSQGRKLVSMSGKEILVDEIIDDGKEEDVYDISVPDFHNFYLEGVDEILVHNCGEQILPDYGNCLLGSYNLKEFVKNPFEKDAYFDFGEFKEVIGKAVEFMDIMIDENQHPLKEQNALDKKMRKIGLGVTALADALAMLNVKYGSEESLDWIENIFSFKQMWEILKSCELGKKKGSAPIWAESSDEEKEAYLNHEFFRRLETIYKNRLGGKKIDLKENMKNGIRNISTSTVAPNGTISIIAGNVTSGIEPLFALRYTRKSRLSEGSVEIVHPPLMDYIDKNGGSPEDFSYVESKNLDWEDRIKVQAKVQSLTMDSISSTINLPESTKVEDIEEIYMAAWKVGLKGVTVYRENCSLGGILEEKKEESEKSESAAYMEVDMNDREDREVWGDILVKKIDLSSKEDAIRIRAKWKNTIKTYITITFDDDRNPVEIFTKVPKEAGYDERGNFSPTLYLERQGLWDSLCRMISLNLQYGINIREVLKQLGKSSYSMYDLPAILKRALEKNKKTKQIAGKSYRKCPECGKLTLKMEGGCEVCESCGYSKCS